MPALVVVEYLDDTSPVRRPGRPKPVHPEKAARAGRPQPRRGPAPPTDRRTRRRPVHLRPGRLPFHHRARSTLGDQRIRHQMLLDQELHPRWLPDRRIDDSRWSPVADQMVLDPASHQDLAVSWRRGGEQDPDWPAPVGRKARWLDEPRTDLSASDEHRRSTTGPQWTDLAAHGFARFRRSDAR